MELNDVNECFDSSYVDSLVDVQKTKLFIVMLAMEWVRLHRTLVLPTKLSSVMFFEITIFKYFQVNRKCIRLLFCHNFDFIINIHMGRTLTDKMKSFFDYSIPRQWQFNRHVNQNRETLVPHAHYIQVDIGLCAVRRIFFFHFYAKLYFHFTFTLCWH